MGRNSMAEDYSTGENLERFQFEIQQRLIGKIVVGLRLGKDFAEFLIQDGGAIRFVFSDDYLTVAMSDGYVEDRKPASVN
jgi:hypothetical protein